MAPSVSRMLDAGIVCGLLLGSMQLKVTEQFREAFRTNIL